MRRLVSLSLVLAFTASTISAQTTREVTAAPHALIRVHTKVRVTTLLVLPPSEEILDVVCGDKDDWVVSGAQNLAYVKPGKAGATTDLDLVTASGRVYAFWLTEGPGDADVQVYVTAEGGAKTAADPSQARLYSKADVDALQQALDQAHRETEAARDLAGKSAQEAEAARQAATKAADARIDAFRASYPTRLAFPYLVKTSGKPFFVTAIAHDDRFTYIYAHAPELPALYEMDGRTPSLVNFQVEDGVYIVPKILDRGYLVLGKEKLPFGTSVWWR